jgi:hypothetical protein
MITTEQFKQYLEQKAEIEKRAIEVAEILSSIDFNRYPLLDWSREVEIDEDMITVRSESGRSYDETNQCSFDSSRLFQTNEQIEFDLNAEIIAKKQREAEALAQSQRDDRIATEKRERAIYETLKAKYEN